MTLLTRIDHLELLDRMRTFLVTPGNLAGGEGALLAAQIEAVQHQFRSWQVPWPVDVHHGVIYLPWDIHHFLAPTRRALVADMASYCREHWSEVGDDRDPATIDDEATVEACSGHRPGFRIGIGVSSIAPEPLTGGAMYVDERVLRISTEHLTAGTRDKLAEWTGTRAADHPLEALGTLFGWLVPTARHHIVAELPEDLALILRFARTHGADYALIGPQGELIEPLPLFG
ncbi:hypothetical protein PX554_20100 [Sphingomonas sp. H39-1-10]|uniref:DUF5983 family protein n=1 Tax=Sphingomonas pollutisoli TaxID=3030829 RepID=UPI0023B9BD05|nr:hypothetical protein [Sphingomonas pollutisoli]MDF0490436.1 hypothetical protein [Sphingomonas pollutisoli]